jgi:trimeric autotransporter adhesin
MKRQLRLPFWSAALGCVFLTIALSARAHAQFICAGSSDGSTGLGPQGATASGSATAVACGTNANAQGTSGSANTAFGFGANALGGSSSNANASNTAIGGNANASGNSSVNTAIGGQADAHGFLSHNVAVGDTANASGDAAVNVASGSKANASGGGSENVATGFLANASGTDISDTTHPGANTATGAQSDAHGVTSTNTSTGFAANSSGTSSSNIATGKRANASGNTSSNVAAGDNANASGDGGSNIATGKNSNASGGTASKPSFNTATGDLADAHGANSGNIATGTQANAGGDGSSNIATGTKTFAGGSGSNNVATGNSALAFGDASNNVAIGSSANASGNGGSNLALGDHSTANGANGHNTAVGANALATGNDSAAFGSGAQAAFVNSAAFGVGANAGQPAGVRHRNQHVHSAGSHQHRKHGRAIRAHRRCHHRCCRQSGIDSDLQSGHGLRSHRDQRSPGRARPPCRQGLHRNRDGICHVCLTHAAAGQEVCPLRQLGHFPGRERRRADGRHQALQGHATEWRICLRLPRKHGWWPRGPELPVVTAMRSKRRDTMSDSKRSIIAVTAILLIAPLSQSQAPKGSDPATKLPPQQLQQALNARLEGKFKLGPKVENPRAADSSIIGVLRSQRQRAELELQQISLADGSVRPTAPLAKPATPAPPVRVLPPAGCVGSQISTVNGLANGVLFTPIQDWNLYTIKGCGFGTRPGNVYLQGPFKGGRLQLQPSPGTNWSATAIIAVVSPRVSGEMDQENVTLVVEPAGGAPIQKPGMKFYAARDTVQLPSIPQTIVRFGQPWTGSALPGSGFHYTTPAPHAHGWGAEVERFAPDTTNQSAFNDGSDYFDFGTLNNGFVVQSARMTSADLGKFTSSNFNFGGSIQYEGDQVHVSWPHQDLDRIGSPGSYVCVSLYALNVWVTGPRGVNPWRTVMAVPHQPAH